jgi:membrane fusion protein (multidrug efflux system)
VSEQQIKPRISRIFKHVALAGFVVFAILLGAIVVLAYRSNERSTDDAYITGHLHPIASRVTGTVESVLVDDNQFVHAGDELVRIDARDFEVRLALEEARVEQALSQQESAKAQIEQAQANISGALAEHRKAQFDFSRASQLVRETPQGLSRQEYDAAEAAYTSAGARLAQARAQLSSARAGFVAAQAVERQGRANVRDARLQLSYTRITAPVDGYVGKKTVETGARISAGQPLMSVVEADVWVVANFRETQLKHLKVGDPVEITVDAAPDVKLTGHVGSVSPATGAQFALLPPDNATGNFTKVVQRVPVKILLENLPNYKQRLTPGLSVTATLLSEAARDAR